MAILIFEHHPLERPSRLGDVLRDHSHRLRVCQLHKGDDPPPDLDSIDGVVSLGGPMNVDETDRYPWMPRELELLAEAHKREVPIVGICLGAQLLAKALGGDVTAMDQPEVGWEPVKQSFPGTMDPLHNGIPWTTRQFHMHGYEIVDLPAEGLGLAGSATCRNQSFKVGLTSYGFQYHFEWTRAEIQAVVDANSETIGKAGTTPDELRRGLEQHYDLYRHLGDRLCNNIAGLLMPVDKRFGTRHAPAEPNPIANWQPARS